MSSAFAAFELASSALPPCVKAIVLTSARYFSFMSFRDLGHAVERTFVRCAENQRDALHQTSVSLATVLRAHDSFSHHSEHVSHHPRRLSGGGEAHRCPRNDFLDPWAPVTQDLRFCHHIRLHFRS